MRKILTTLCAVAMLAVAVNAMADGTLYSVKDAWYFDTNEAGKLTVNDNKVIYTFDVNEGTNPLRLQRDCTGQLRFVDFKATVAECQHYFNQWNAITIQERGCTTEGIYLWPCDYCDETIEVILPGFHFMDDRNYEWSVWKYSYEAPTCSFDGFEGYACVRCGELADDAEIIPALGHIEPLVVVAEIVNSAWNGENGNDARFDVTLELTFTVSRGDDINTDVVIYDVYYRNVNFNNLSDTLTLVVGCHEVDVEIVLLAEKSNQSAVFSVASADITFSECICED